MNLHPSPKKEKEEKTQNTSVQASDKLHPLQGKILQPTATLQPFISRTHGAISNFYSHTLDTPCTYRISA